jgi:hypothetical protein
LHLSILWFAFTEEQPSLLLYSTPILEDFHLLSQLDYGSKEFDSSEEQENVGVGFNYRVLWQ